VRGQRFDLIVSNPPYVRAGDVVLADLRYEPVDALVSGQDGLDAIRALAVECVEILADNGILLIEHGADQRHEVATLLSASGWTEITTHRDFSGHPRVTAARRGGK
jgi:release factor glutamine methyltransferase